MAQYQIFGTNSIMKKLISIIFLVLQPVLILAGESVFKQAFPDASGVFFSNTGGDGKTDVSDELQEALNKIKTEKAFGTLYVPEGKYLISKTVFIPNSVRIIGYGNKRPEFILGKNSPGYDGEKPKYMFWFTGSIVTDPENVNDANAGTFYSGISNVDFRIEEKNPQAVAIRAHVAQHGVFSHLTFNIGSGYAGMHEVGNEVEDAEFIGGKYGISSGRTSPGWPMVLTDTRFRNQKCAAIVSRNTGMAIVNMSVTNAPCAVELENGVPDRLYMENCHFDNISRCAVLITAEEGACNQINLIDIHCRKTPVFAKVTARSEEVKTNERSYCVKNFTYGLISKAMGDDSKYGLVYSLSPESYNESYVPAIPSIPDMREWVSAADYGAKGDGETDDTQAIQRAIDENRTVFLPEGWYRITKTIKLKKGSRLIGLHPFATQIVIHDGTPAFSGFGSPVPMIESSHGGDDILYGIGINTNANNNRAVGVKWMAGETSFLNDVKFVGGHGSIARPNKAYQDDYWAPAPRISTAERPAALKGPDIAWDTQYWSLWITDGGGGTIKNVWSANSYATAGLYASNTETPAQLYAISIEHHMREEARLNNVSNWKFYGLQFEEEKREGGDCISLTMDNCHNLMFANTWFYRVIKVNTPRNFGISASGCSDIEFKNMRAWTQVLYLTAATVYDPNKNLSIWPNDFAYACICGGEEGRTTKGAVRKLATGFEFASGAAADSHGNVYFCENRLKKVYKYDAKKREIHLVADFPWKPFAVAVDTEDNPIVICRVDPQPCLIVNGKPQAFTELPDANPWYCGWGNGGWLAMAYVLDTKNDTMIPLKLVASTQISGASRFIYPAHRWREDFHSNARSVPEMSFVSIDGKTAIPQFYDLNRSVQLLGATPGQTICQCWEDYKKTYAFIVEENGRLKETGLICNRGEYGLATDMSGKLYLAEGQIFVYDIDGNEIKRIDLPERPLSIAIGGEDFNTLFVTTNESFYSVDI